MLPCAAFLGANRYQPAAKPTPTIPIAMPTLATVASVFTSLPSDVSEAHALVRETLLLGWTHAPCHCDFGSPL